MRRHKEFLTSSMRPSEKVVCDVTGPSAGTSTTGLQ